MVVGIEAALALKPKPDSVLVLTDGYTPYPAKPYRIPVVFGILLSHRQRRKPPLPNSPPWSKSAVIEISIPSGNPLN